MACSWHVHYSLLVYDLTCSWLVHQLFMTFGVLFMTVNCSWLVQNLFKSYLFLALPWFVKIFVMSPSWKVYDLFMTCLWFNLWVVHDGGNLPKIFRGNKCQSYALWIYPQNIRFHVNLSSIFLWVIIATLGSILDSQLSWKSGKFQLAIWSHEVLLFSVRTNPTWPTT